MKVLKHFHTINTHKWEVFKLCCKVGIPFRGMIHDLSKYSFEEFIESAKFYTDGKKSPIENAKKTNGYSRAWLHHKGKNKHHFEYWNDYCALDETPVIPFKYMLEMVCDRIAASKVYKKDSYTNNSPLEYFNFERTKMRINPKMEVFLETVFINLSKKGEKFITKENIKNIYDKCLNYDGKEYL